MRLDYTFISIVRKKQIFSIIFYILIEYINNILLITSRLKLIFM